MKCPRCQSKNANKVTFTTHYCMECGVEFDTHTWGRNNILTFLYVKPGKGNSVLA